MEGDGNQRGGWGAGGFLPVLYFDEVNLRV